MKKPRQCKQCEQTKEKESFRGNRTMCKKCQGDNWAERKRQNKIKAVKYKGGKCVNCGYNKYFSSLQFHHIDPSKKKFSIGDTGMSFENMKDELDKCILLCANCHAAIHSNDLHIEDIKGLEKNNA